MTQELSNATFQQIKQAYGNNAISCTWIFEWYARLWDGRENLKDDKRSGRLTAIRTPDMIETLCEFISTDRRMTLQMLEE
jgi:hypothetical protein